MWQRYCLSPRDPKKNLDVNAAIWCIFLSVTLQVAVHHGTDYMENLRSTKNQSKKFLRQLFQVTGRLITDHAEITGLTTIDWQQPVWRETALLTDRAVQFATAKNLRLLWLSALSVRYQYWTSQSMGKQENVFFGNTLLKKCGSDGAVEQTRSSATMWDMLRWIDVQMWVYVSFLKRTWARRRCADECMRRWTETSIWLCRGQEVSGLKILTLLSTIEKNTIQHQ